ncbi:hypothetical protein HYT24_02065 [Candidatus Pacearchaeota archaeon]|nr:hypothetical protein [Candidatus Pacearchaeota archaeon]
MAEEKQKTEKVEEKKEVVETPKTETKKETVTKKPVKKKTEATVKGIGVPMSTKTSVEICRFIKGKRIDKAITELQEVTVKKRAIPMRGQIPHKKGMMGGRYPKNASNEFIRLLKSLSANANVNEIENPIIVKASASNTARPFGRGGSVRRKRTYVILAAASKPEMKK